MKSISKKEQLTPLTTIFTAYCKLDPTSRAKNVQHLPLTQSDEWLRAAGILDMDKITSTDTGLIFFKFRKRALTYDEYMIYLQKLAIEKGLDLEELKYNLQKCGQIIKEGEQ